MNHCWVFDQWASSPYDSQSPVSLLQANFLRLNDYCIDILHFFSGLFLDIQKVKFKYFKNLTLYIAKKENLGYRNFAFDYLHDEKIVHSGYTNLQDFFV